MPTLATATDYGWVRFRASVRIFSFDPADHRAAYRERQWVHIRNGIDPEFYGHLLDFAERHFSEHRVEGKAIGGAKTQALFEFPDEVDFPGELFDTVASLCGLNRPTMTLSERHIKAYDADVPPDPPAHKDRVSSQVSMGLSINPAWEEFEITNEIFSKKVEPTLIQPTFVTHLPKELCPLAKLNAEDPTVLDVFELTIGGMEVAPAYSEQNDPDAQREMFEKQAGEEKQNIDQDFLLALEHGMPPAGGMGLGIDRLCMMLLGQESIRDVILFPQLKPK